jgi:predicted GIY-YIG superfamily endonuclease
LRECPSHYAAIRRNNWDCDKHLIRKKCTILTFDDYTNIVKKYKYMRDFSRENPNVHSIGIRRGWHQKIAKKYLTRGSIKYPGITEDLVKKRISIYSNMASFRNAHSGSYLFLKKHRLISKYKKYLMPETKLIGFNDIAKIAKKYKTKKQFRINEPYAYERARRLGVIHKVTRFLLSENTTFFKGVYVIMFKELNTVYVGVTCDYNRRYHEHSTNEKSPVYEYIQRHDHKYITYGQSLPTSIATKLEFDLIENYKKNGYCVLNKSKGGECGSLGKWTKNALEKEVSKYKTIADLRKNNETVYNKITRKHEYHYLKARLAYANKIKGRP